MPKQSNTPTNGTTPETTTLAEEPSTLLADDAPLAPATPLVDPAFTAEVQDLELIVDELAPQPALEVIMPVDEPVPARAETPTPDEPVVLTDQETEATPANQAPDDAADAPMLPADPIVVTFRADTLEPQPPAYQEPHEIGDTWPANRTVIVGRIQRLKGRAPRVRPTEGGAYTLYTIHVAEAASDDMYADVAQMRVPLLVPDSLPRAAQKLLEKDGLVAIQGRVTQETVEDRRYSDQSGTGKQILTLPYIKVQDVRAVAPTTAQYAVIRVGGTIQRVTGVGIRLARGRADRYHIVELVATETYQRPAPAVGTRTLHTPIYVAVPEDADHADLVLRKGNRFEVECELIELGEFLPEDHYSLQGLSDEDRQRRRRRDRIYLVATRLQPVGEAVPLSNHERKALAFRLQQGGQQRRGQFPRRQPQAEAS